MSRSYSDKTYKILFGFCDNQCAYPGCTQAIIQRNTEQSNTLVVGQIAHIYAVKDNGPRGKPDLTTAQRNAPENLILLCPTHHRIVDGQHETYPVEMLIAWKEKQEARMRGLVAKEFDNAQLGGVATAALSQSLIDSGIEEQATRLQHARFFVGFESKSYAWRLARRIIDGDLSGGSPNVRARALAWCARSLAWSDSSDKAEEVLQQANSLSDVVESTIAEAFLASADGGRSHALTVLADLDTASARTAALQIVEKLDGATAAETWSAESGLKITDFDADGKFVWFKVLMKQDKWSPAFEQVSALSDGDFEECPPLRFMAATALLSQSVPNEYRHIFLTELPFALREFPLKSDKKSIALRRDASVMFERCGQVAREFDLIDAANIAEDYVLWLLLRDPDSESVGRERLAKSLRDPSHSLRRLRFALQYDIKLDLDAVEAELEQRTAQSDGASLDVAQARFALALSQESAIQAADYIRRYRDQMIQHLRPGTVAMVEIQALASAGLGQRAEQRLSELLSTDLSDDERSRAEMLIAEAQGADRVAGRRTQFERSGELDDLRALLVALEEKGDMSGICEYGAVLFSKTKSLPDAERLILALNQEQRYANLLEFYEENLELLADSPSARMSAAWAFYFVGDFVESKRALGSLPDASGHANGRALIINLAITSGDWDSLIEFASEEWLHRLDRTPDELLQAAQLAYLSGSPRAQDLVHSAVERADDDANVWAGAYFLASNAGWEDDPVVAGWLQKAALLSGDSGPVQRMSLKDLVQRRPDWNQHETNVWEQLTRGEVPIFAAAKAINRSVIEMVLAPALANPKESDPRRRVSIYAYSGARSALPDLELSSIALDPVALYTLSIIGMLERVIDHCDSVVVAHSTLAWIFQEKEKAQFHQPSRFENAHRARELIASGQMVVVDGPVAFDEQLAGEIGHDLATLLAAATDTERNDHHQALVIRSSPVHRVASLMEEEADMSAYNSHLCGCTAIVDKLRAKGQITLEEERQARAYLALHQRDWPSQPAIDDGAHLYLDGVALTYLRHLGLLEKLEPAGLLAYVLPDVEEQAGALIRYEKRSEEVVAIVDRVRTTVFAGISSKKVRMTPAPIGSDDDALEMRSNPTMALMERTHDVDAVVIDDRFVNQHAMMQSADGTVPVLTTVELLSQLAANGVVTDKDLFANNTALRQAGYAFVPLTPEELLHHLDDSPVADGTLVESAELRAIRESLLATQMGTALQLPKELPWLNATVMAMVRATKEIWLAGGDTAATRARAEWLVDWSDARGWASFLEADAQPHAVSEGRGAQLLQLLTAPTGAAKEVAANYLEWVDEYVVAPTEETQPDVFKWMVGRVRELVDESASLPVDEEGGDVAPSNYVRSSRALAMAELFPVSIRASLVADADFRTEYGLTVDSVISFSNADVGFQRSALFGAIRDAYDAADSDECVVEDQTGLSWHLELDRTPSTHRLTLRQGERSIVIPNFAVLSSTDAERLRSVTDDVQQLQLSQTTAAKWRTAVKKDALGDDEVIAYHCELDDTPVRFVESLQASIVSGTSKLTAMVPRSKQYYEVLIGVYRDEVTILEYATAGARDRLQWLREEHDVNGVMSGMLLSGHTSLCAEMSLAELNEAQVSDLYERLLGSADLYSQLGGIELGLAALKCRPALEKQLKSLINVLVETILDEDSPRFKLLSSLLILVDGELARTQALSQWPPFLRRLAVTAHASLIERVIVEAGVIDDDFMEWPIKNRGQLFSLRTLVDLRLEPRWQPEFVSEHQLRFEFVGRLLNIARAREKLWDSLGFSELLNDGSSGLMQQFPWTNTGLPGPLEGGIGGDAPMPKELVKILDDSLDSPKIAVTNFVPLVNSTLQFEMQDKWLGRVTDLLRQVSNGSILLPDSDQWGSILTSLATLAATTRNVALADELQNVVKRELGRQRSQLQCADAFRIAMGTAAARESLSEWVGFVGEAMTGFAFQPLDAADADMLGSNVDWLCHLIPELWTTCGRANAALKSVTKH